MIKKLNGFTTSQYEYSPHERKILLVLYILTMEKRILLEDLVQLVQVSRNTALADLKKIKAELVKFKLALNFNRKHGYNIIGNEHGKRNILILNLSQIISKHGWEYLISHVKYITNDNKNVKGNKDHEELLIIKNILSNCEELLGVQYTDEVLESLSVYMYLFRNRIVNGKCVEMEDAEKDVLRETKQFEAAKYIAKQFERVFFVDFPIDEIYYITTHLLGAKVNAQQKDFEKSEIDGIHSMVGYMIKDFQHYACVIFQDFEGLASYLYLHMKPAYYRVKYGIEIENPLLYTIQQNYEEV